jgi:hypothetical protein
MGRLLSIMSLGYLIVLFLIERKLAPRAGVTPAQQANLGYHK